MRLRRHCDGFRFDLRTPVKPTRAVLCLHASRERPRIIGYRKRAASRCHPGVQPRRVARGEAPAQPALALGAEGHARRQAQAVLLHQALGEGQRVVLALDAEEGVHAARRAAPPRTPGSAASRGTSRSRQARRSLRPGRGTKSVGDRQRRQAAALHEHRRARGVELDQLADRVEMAAAAAPASPGASRSSGSSWRSCAPRPAGRRRRRCRGSSGAARPVAEVEPLVDLVGDDPGAGAAAVVEDGLLLGARQRPAGGVVRRVDQQHAGAPVSRPRAASSRSSAQHALPRPQRHALDRARPGSPAARSGWATPAPPPRPRRRRRPASASPASARSRPTR